MEIKNIIIASAVVAIVGLIIAILLSVAEKIFHVEVDEKEIKIIVEAIKNHSTKNKRHDRYSELLKMCDVVDSYLHEPEMILDHDRKYYLEKWRKLDE